MTSQGVWQHITPSPSLVGLLFILTCSLIDRDQHIHIPAPPVHYHGKKKPSTTNPMQALEREIEAHGPSDPNRDLPDTEAQRQHRHNNTRVTESSNTRSKQLLLMPTENGCQEST